jgi:hypothetical protein
LESLIDFKAKKLRDDHDHDRDSGWQRAQRKQWVDLSCPLNERPRTKTSVRTMARLDQRLKHYVDDRQRELNSPPLTLYVTLSRVST